MSGEDGEAKAATLANDIVGKGTGTPGTQQKTPAKRPRPEASTDVAPKVPAKEAKEESIRDGTETLEPADSEESLGPSECTLDGLPEDKKEKDSVRAEETMAIPDTPATGMSKLKVWRFSTFL